MNETLDFTVRKLSEEKWEPWTSEGYRDAASLMMIPKKDAAAISCRIIRLNPGGHTGLHSHDRIHHVITIKGVAELETDTESIELDHLTAVTVKANVPHRFINKSNDVALIQVLNIFKE
jgi:quercetin dioxygenase-like cupin family protein